MYWIVHRIKLHQQIEKYQMVFQNVKEVYKYMKEALSSTL